MYEKEEYLTKEDFNSEITQEEIDLINGHPEGDLSMYDKKRTISNKNSVTQNLPYLETTLIQRGISENYEGKIEIKDFVVTGFKKKEIPNCSEILDRFEGILRVYQKEDQKNLFLIKKGQRIEGLHNKNYRGGNITSDILVAYSEQSPNNLKLIHSLDKKDPNGVFFKYKDYFGNKKVLKFTKKSIIYDCNPKISLKKIKSVDDLRRVMEKSS